MQELVDRGTPEGLERVRVRDGGAWTAPGQERAWTVERAARESLKAQIARLEGELSSIVSDSFPFLPAPAGHEERPAPGPACPTWRRWSAAATAWPGVSRSSAAWRARAPSTSAAPASSWSG